MVDEKIIINKIEDLIEKVKTLDEQYNYPYRRKYFTFEHVAYMLDKIIIYINEIPKEESEDMTEKQRKYIDFICSILEIEFKGTTKYDAWKFINDNKDEAHEVYNSVKEYYYDETDYMLFPDEGYYC